MKTNSTETESTIRHLVPRIQTNEVWKEVNDYLCCNGIISLFDHDYSEMQKIIGHPITLEDVLEALEIAHESGALITKWGPSFSDLIIVIYRIWNKGADFSDQSEETKLFIKNLLK